MLSTRLQWGLTMMAYRRAQGAGWSLVCIVVFFACSVLSLAQNADQQGAGPQAGGDQAAETASAPAPPPGSAAAGRDLFFGTRRFAKGGPACASCHQSAGTPFPNGGTLGPDLTGIYTQFGPEALQSFLQTLFFPTMAPIFDKRPLTPQEQSDLAAFFQQTSNQPPPTSLAAN